MDTAGLSSTSPASLERVFAEFNTWAARLDAGDEALRAAVAQLRADLAQTSSRLREEVHLRAETERHFASLLTLAPFGLVLLDQGRVADFNAAAATVLPQLRAGAAWNLPADWVRRGTGTHYEVGRGPGGRVVDVQPLAAQGRVRMVRLEDVTDAVRSRERSEREERLAAMGRMAAELAHQLRTPLCTATLYAGELKAGACDPAQRATAEGLEAQLGQLERLITRMLGFVRSGAQTQEVGAIEPLLREQAAIIAPQFERLGVQLELALAAPHSLVRSDRLQIGTALLALLENALQHAPPSSTVTLSCTAHDHRVEITVADEGPGGPELASLPMEPFATSRAGGTGLGLAIARAAADAHGGELRACARAPHGALFTLTLPALVAV